MLHASDTCILCLSKKPEKKKNIIPDVIGGRLKSCILCNDCNSIMGYKLEKTFKTDPMIRIAIENLRDKTCLQMRDVLNNRKPEFVRNPEVLCRVKLNT